MIFRVFLSGLALVAAGTSHAVAQDGACEARGSNGMVSVVLCPSGQDKTMWQKAGKAACGDRKPCGAWIWDDVANLPVDIPDSHDKLPGDSVRSALAIWVNEQDRLVVIEKE